MIKPKTKTEGSYLLETMASKKQLTRSVMLH